MSCEQIVTESLIVSLIESAADNTRCAVEEMAPRKFDRVPKKSELAQLVEDCRHEGADSAVGVIMSESFKIARTINEIFEADGDPESIARILAIQLRCASNESRRMVWEILADELGRVKP